ncbi:DUF2510 domain-containing protein [Agromyces aerolatus]|uniref:DUF2510 domain-containing protein n=1 Tax=Agromyces sp. LY-1074 TaxID=3074080 RepID=UPI002859829C|nr:MULTISPECIES: DUF2510 domain-containing protein [unclassified Agromyces]MDR5698543.1 DUF2510 domain-containing protein [Agromyces sp. LY-1074]MDR5704837.1 DUF2510 domain-containing protein [Agromyces sp. LY-1358]
MTDPNLPPAGWYDDGTGTGTVRYWDGAQWTEHTSSATPADAIASEPHGAEASAPEAATLDAEATAAEASVPAAAQPAADWTAPGEQAEAAPVYAQSVAAQSAYTQDAGTESAHAQHPYAQSPYAQSPYAQGQYAQSPYDQNPYAQQPYAQPGSPEVGGKKPVHVLGIIALAVAGVGFVLACIPVTVLFGWFVLPIGVILSIVALFMKGAKWPGIVGLSVSVVGLIVAAIVSIVAFVFAVGEIERSIDEFDSGSSALEEELDGAFTPEVFGSRDDPLAIGETITTDEFEVVINSIDLDATEQVLAADEYNEPPAEGETYAIVNLTVTYTGEESSTDSMVGIDYVGADGVVKSDSYAYAWGIEPEFGMTELFAGGSVTSNLVLMLPADPDGVLLVSPGFFDEAWVSLR